MAERKDMVIVTGGTGFIGSATWLFVPRERSGLPSSGKFLFPSVLRLLTERQ